MSTAGQKLAVLAVDPSSSRTGGSILGDKTRMERLSREQRRVHPTVTVGRHARWGRAPHAGGDARLRSRRAATSCWSRRWVSASRRLRSRAWSTCSSCCIAPGGGDELQGVKRGIVELADVLVVNKADGDARSAAKRTATDYANALHIGRAGDDDAPSVLTCSALTGDRIAEVWSAIEDRAPPARASGAKDATPRRAGPGLDVVGGLGQPARSLPRRRPACAASSRGWSAESWRATCHRRPRRPGCSTPFASRRHLSRLGRRRLSSPCRGSPRFGRA